MLTAEHSRGVALVSVLVLVAMAAILAASMLRAQKASLEATLGFLQRGQAMQYALGGEELARQLLHRDYLDATGRDHLAEAWAAEQHLDFAEGEVSLQITDLQGRHNVNGLSERNNHQSSLRQWLDKLLVLVEADPAIPAQLQDWIDADSIARPQGAEDYDYLGLEPAYRTASQSMSEVSELRLLTAVSPEVYRRLAPAVTALPIAEASLNVNTASPLVLQSLAPNLGEQAAEALAQRRNEKEGFESVADFLASPELAGLGITGAGLGVESSFFAARIVARYQGRYSYLTSLMVRDPADGSIRVISRNYSRNFSPLTHRS